MKKLVFLLMILMVGVIFISSGFLSKEKESSKSSEPIMTAKFDANGQVIISDSKAPVLRYAYDMVYETDEYALTDWMPMNTSLQRMTPLWLIRAFMLLQEATIFIQFLD